MEQDIFADVAGELQSSPDTLLSLQSAVERARSLLDTLDNLNGDVKAIQSEIRKLVSETIPELMDAAGVKKMEIAGCGLSMKEDFYGGLPKDEGKRKEALNWIKSNGGDGLVSSTLTAEFSQSQANRAMDVFERLKSEGEVVSLDQSVHPMTLKKFARDKMAGGEALDPGKIGLFYAREAKIKRPKE